MTVYLIEEEMDYKYLQWLKCRLYSEEPWRIDEMSNSAKYLERILERIINVESILYVEEEDKTVGLYNHQPTSFTNTRSTGSRD